MKLPSRATIDGLLFAAIAFFGSTQVAFSSEEAYKYVNAYIIFWIKTLASINLATITALKGFRSTSYGEAIADKQAKEKSLTNPADISKPAETSTPKEP